MRLNCVSDNTKDNNNIDTEIIFQCFIWCSKYRLSRYHFFVKKPKHNLQKYNLYCNSIVSLFTHTCILKSLYCSSNIVLCH